MSYLTPRNGRQQLDICATCFGDLSNLPSSRIWRWDSPTDKREFCSVQCLERTLAPLDVKKISPTLSHRPRFDVALRKNIEARRRFNGRDFVWLCIGIYVGAMGTVGAAWIWGHFL